MLNVEDLTLHYGHSQILHGVSLTARAGAVTCVMGTNGVGKTSLMRAISGAHPRSGGTVTLDGETLGVLPAHALAHKGVAVVPQGREIFPLLTVRENLETGFACLPASEHRIPDEIFELFPILKDFLERRGGDLSGGQQQQLAIARALRRRTQAPAARRAHRGHPAQHHPADRPRHRAAARPGRHGHRAGRQLLELADDGRTRRPVLTSDRGAGERRLIRRSCSRTGAIGFERAGNRPHLRDDPLFEWSARHDLPGGSASSRPSSRLKKFSPR